MDSENLQWFCNAVLAKLAQNASKRPQSTAKRGFILFLCCTIRYCDIAIFFQFFYFSHIKHNKTLRYAILADVLIINMRSHSKFGTPVVHLTVGLRWTLLISSLSVHHRLKVAYLIEFFFIIGNCLSD